MTLSQPNNLVEVVDPEHGKCLLALHDEIPDDGRRARNFVLLRSDEYDAAANFDARQLPNEITLSHSRLPRHRSGGALGLSPVPRVNAEWWLTA